MILALGAFLGVAADALGLPSFTTVPKTSAGRHPQARGHTAGGSNLLSAVITPLCANLQ